MPASLAAICPVCHRGPFKLTKTGKLARHGHSFSRGWRTIAGMATDRCYGAGAKPEHAVAKACKILNYYADEAEKTVHACRAEIARLRALAQPG